MVRRHNTTSTTTTSTAPAAAMMIAMVIITAILSISICPPRILGGGGAGLIGGVEAGRTLSDERWNDIRKRHEVIVLNRTAHEEGVHQLESGVLIIFNKTGGSDDADGGSALLSSPTATSPCEVRYRAIAMRNNSVVDASYNHTSGFDTRGRGGGLDIGGDPLTVTPKELLKGWREALQLMREGDFWTLYIPHTLAFGKNGGMWGKGFPWTRGTPLGDEEHINTYSAIIIETELVKVKEGAGKPAVEAAEALQKALEAGKEAAPSQAAAARVASKVEGKNDKKKKSKEGGSELAKAKEEAKKAAKKNKESGGGSSEL